MKKAQLDNTKTTFVEQGDADDMQLIDVDLSMFDEKEKQSAQESMKKNSGYNILTLNWQYEKKQ